VKLLGIGLAPSTGLRKGIVVNMDATVDSIRKAVKEAEASSGVRVKSVAVGISGAHIKGFDSTGATGVRGKEVTALDTSRAIDSAKTGYIPLDREILHIIPTEFLLDGQDGITNPLGMTGVRLEARVHILTGAVSSIQNLLKCCERAGLEVSELVFEPLASAHAVLSGDEKEFGSVLVDIGGGTTDIALFREGSLRHTSVLGIGGNHFTNDIAVGLRVNMQEAERLKKASGAAFPGIVGDSEELEITLPGGDVRTMPRKYIVEVIQPRCEELLEMMKEEIKKCHGYENAPCGVVLTGGASLLSGFDRMAETVLGLPVRVGCPENVKGPAEVAGRPEHATGIGLVTYESAEETVEAARPDVIMSALDRVKGWGRDMFKFTDCLNFNIRKEGGTACLKSRK
jgi:cell division protein FtsA